MEKLPAKQEYGCFDFSDRLTSSLIPLRLSEMSRGCQVAASRLFTNNPPLIAVLYNIVALGGSLFQPNNNKSQKNKQIKVIFKF